MFLESCDRVPLFHHGDGSVAADVTAPLLEHVVEGIAILDR
jgi:hypothetical protein